MTSPAPLPHANVGGLLGLVEAMAATPGRDDLFRLAERLRLQLDELHPLVEAARLLGWAHVEQGDYDLTAEGRRVAAASLAERKQLFRDRVRALPLVSGILDALARRRRVTREQVLGPLRRALGAPEAERQVDTAVNWGRWAELFDYDADDACFLPAGGGSRT